MRGGESVRFGRGDMLFHRDETVRAHRHGVDPAAHKELGEFRVIARCLSAQPNFRAGFVCFADDILDHPFHSLVLLIEQWRQLGRTFLPPTNATSPRPSVSNHTTEDVLAVIGTP
jgi:hypothetical protein